MKLIQEKIIKIVEEYKVLFADEYEAFCRSIADEKELQMDAFASTGLEGSIKQLANKKPLVLHNLLERKLDDEERRYYNSNEGALWFGKHFKNFSPAEKL